MPIETQTALRQAFADVTAGDGISSKKVASMLKTA